MFHTQMNNSFTDLLDWQLFASNDVDEFSAVLRKDQVPKILITTSRLKSTVCLPCLYTSLSHLYS